MAYEIDPMGYYTGLGGSDYSLGNTGVETEEERQRRLRLEAEKNTPVKQTITIDPNTGAQTVKIEGSAHNLSAANPNTPTITQPVAPDESAAEMARLRRQEATATGTPVAAVAPQTRSIGPSTNMSGGYVPAVPGAAYNAYIAKNESGANPNIGYHNQARGTAYGPYGITSAAYQDARKLNPALPEDITKATPEQQTAAQNAFTQQNAKYLQSYGIEPTPGNLAAAHFLGAKGLSDYLTNGTISPMAAAANGGEDKVRQIVQQRLASAPSPASGAVTETSALNAPVNPYAMAAPTGLGLQGGVAGAPAPTPGGSADAISRYHAIQDRPDQLMAYAQDTNNPEWLRNRAQTQVMDNMRQEVAKKEAQDKFNAMMAAGDTKGIANAVQGRGAKGEEGSYLKMIALSFISPQLAGAEAVKLGLAPSKYVQSTYMDKDGNEVAVELKMGSDGKLLGGTKLDGTPLTTEEMNLAGGAIGRGKVTTGAEFFQDKSGQIYQAQRDEKGRTKFINTQTNRAYTGAEPLQRLRDIAAVDTKRQTTMIQMAKELATMDYAAKLKALAEYRQSEINAGRPDLTPDEMATLIGTPPSPQKAVGLTQEQLRQQQQQAGSGSSVAPAGKVNLAPVAPPKRETVEEAKRREAEQKVERDIGEAGRKEIVKKASDVIAGSDKIVTELVNVERAANDAISKPNNFGTLLQGQLPYEWAVSEKFKTPEYVATQNVLDIVNKQAAVNAKMLGTNPTDRDLQFVTSTKPDRTWAAADVAEWLRRSADGTRRTLDFAKKQIETGGRYMPETPQPTAAAETGVTASGNKYKFK